MHCVFKSVYFFIVRFYKLLDENLQIVDLVLCRIVYRERIIGCWPNEQLGLEFEIFFLDKIFIYFFKLRKDWFKYGERTLLTCNSLIRPRSFSFSASLDFTLFLRCLISVDKSILALFNSNSAPPVPPLLSAAWNSWPLGVSSSSFPQIYTHDWPIFYFIYYFMFSRSLLKSFSLNTYIYFFLRSFYSLF